DIEASRVARGDIEASTAARGDIGAGRALPGRGTGVASLALPVQASRMIDLDFASASQLLTALRDGETSSQAILEHQLSRLARHTPAVNAVMVLEEERARAGAVAADAARSRGEATGALRGLPMTIKEVFERRGLPTTAGVESLRDHVSTVDAVAVERLLEAGA